jgi:hypothetical protein
MTRFPAAVLSFLAAALFILPPGIAAARPTPLRLLLLFTNDVHGYVEPCG